MTQTVNLRALHSGDAAAALTLYNELTFGPKTAQSTAFKAVIDHPGTTVFGAFVGDHLVAMLTLHLLPNVTWDARPYALIENVITTSAYRKRGIGKRVMRFAIDHAWTQNAFKIMLMTGKKRDAEGFYAAVGFSQEDKTAMVLRRP